MVIQKLFLQLFDIKWQTRFYNALSLNEKHLELRAFPFSKNLIAELNSVTLVYVILVLK